jgi:hypothetical protein
MRGHIRGRPDPLSPMLTAMYSALSRRVKVERPCLAELATVVAVLLLALFEASTLSGATASPFTVDCSPEPLLTALFTPRHPQLGRYEACSTARPITEIIPANWKVESLGALEAFGLAGPYNRSDLARLYGGRRIRVARGFDQSADRFESFELVSPYPDATFSRLLPGTLIIRYVVQ